MTYGHLGYIQYLYNNHSLPDFSPIGKNQFYHPPLFHCLGALVMKIIVSIWKDNYGRAFEALQVINSVIAGMTVILIYLSAKKLKIKGKMLVVLTVFFSFCPIFFILGVTLNNDCLVVFFCVAAFYFTLRWLEKSTYLNIIAIAFTLGLGMLTKTSAALCAPAIACVLIYGMVNNRHQWKKYILQFMVFGVICVPIGSFWIVRNQVLFDVPFDYILDLGEKSSQYIGNYPLFDRIGIPSFSRFLQYKINWNNISGHTNIWAQTMLTMTFDEGILNINNKPESVLAIILLWGSTIIYIIGFISLIKIMLLKKINGGIRLLLGVMFATFMVFYLKFCFDYPQVCTMNFRYIVITLVICLLSLGICQSGNNGKSTFKIFVISDMMAVSILSGILFIA